MANKFTYDTAAKLFILNAGVTTLDLKPEFYSWIKSDWKTDNALNKFNFPIRPIGGQDVGGGVTISAYYQLLNGWKVRPQEADHILTVVGNVITDDASDPFVSTLGSYNVRTKFVVSANSLSTGGGASVGAIADAVWDEPMAGHTDVSTFGGWYQKLLTAAEYLGLR